MALQSVLYLDRFPHLTPDLPDENRSEHCTRGDLVQIRPKILNIACVQDAFFLAKLSVREAAFFGLRRTQSLEFLDEVVGIQAHHFQCFTIKEDFNELIKRLFAVIIATDHVSLKTF